MKAAQSTTAVLVNAGPARALAYFGLAISPATLFAAWMIAPSGVYLTAIVLAVGFALAVRSMAARYPHDRLGACNVVTATRLALASILVATLSGDTLGAPDWIVFGIAVATLSLDGVDGWLARKQDLCSEFGARFDMEVDSALAAILALYAAAAGYGGLELIVLGASRYLFIVATALWPALAAPLPHSLARKAVCALQITTLALLSLGFLPDGIMRTLSIGVALLVAWSFARDVRWLTSTS
ncbi:CDP-alcohol phosphatidyltransferase [Roseivivax jejudonensis]|uniref:CDP-alcohol phosphatidyltransferase n=1 Tax=Roseivivax jejudonensis TaxID=1529041 RepID=A0A1X6YV00_9RHOB|nr:CDP-alcohol phosphatidyltransferase family protein [Roseivivax jejudonensis]SLN32207.1 CDP-alcohol phosphatidyltransferase [Roseivivax jejudonensis]